MCGASDRFFLAPILGGRLHSNGIPEWGPGKPHACIGGRRIALQMPVHTLGGERWCYVEVAGKTQSQSAFGRATLRSGFFSPSLILRPEPPPPKRHQTAGSARGTLMVSIAHGLRGTARPTGCDRTLPFLG